MEFKNKILTLFSFLSAVLFTAVSCGTRRQAAPATGTPSILFLHAGCSYAAAGKRFCGADRVCLPASYAGACSGGG